MNCNSFWVSWYCARTMSVPPNIASYGIPWSTWYSEREDTCIQAGCLWKKGGIFSGKTFGCWLMPTSDSMYGARIGCLAIAAQGVAPSQCPSDPNAPTPKHIRNLSTLMGRLQTKSSRTMEEDTQLRMDECV